MDLCPYPYCRSPRDAGAGECPVCGLPRNRTALADLASFWDRCAGDRLADLPPRRLDMHQIVPAGEAALDAQLAAMERFGIERALLQSAPPQASSLWGDRQLRRAPRDRFWISQFVDPRDDGAMGRLEEIAGAGIRVVKLLPPAGFYGNEPALDPFWDAMERLGLVAMIHTGFITARHKQEERRAGIFLSSRYADPLAFDRIARQFPRLRLILCHLGGATHFEAAARLVTEHDNVWGDVSGSGVMALRRLLRIGAEVDWNKVFWGNDSPPFAYPVNLRLLLRAVGPEPPAGLLDALLLDNGRRFARQFLS